MEPGPAGGLDHRPCGTDNLITVIVFGSDLNQNFADMFASGHIPERLFCFSLGEHRSLNGSDHTSFDSVIHKARHLIHESLKCRRVWSLSEDAVESDAMESDVIEEGEQSEVLVHLHIVFADLQESSVGCQTSD